MSEATSENKNDGARVEVAAGAPVFKWNGTRIANPNPPVEMFDFRNPGVLTASDLRQLAATHEKFVQHLSARLSTFLRMECVLKITKSGNTPFAKFTESIISPSHVTLFQVEPLRGIGILDVSLPIALAFADRLLGGKGIPPETPRALTEIEAALIEDAVQIILAEWVHQWEDDESHFQPQCIGHETSVRFLQTSEPDAPMLTTNFEIALGENVQPMQLGVPYSMIENIVKKLQRGSLAGNDRRHKKIAWRMPFDGIPVPVTAEWAVKQMPVREVLELKYGDVLEMPRELIDRTRIRLSSTPEFLGTIGIENSRVAVQLTKRIPSE